MSRRFNRDPSDTDFLTDLNKYAAHGQFVPTQLTDSLFSDYESDPGQSVVVSVPSFITPRSGTWALLDAFVVRSSTANLRQNGGYFKVEACLRVSDSSRVLGTYSQRESRLSAGVPFALFANGLTLPRDAVLDVRVSQYGFPMTSLAGTSVQWRVNNIGG